MSLEVRITRRLAGFTLDVAFEAPAGGVTALFGPSGAGKSSIVHAVAGLIRPDHGRIVIAGRTVLDTEAGIFIPAQHRRAGLVFQDARLFPHMSVEKNLLFGWRRAGRARRASSPSRPGPQEIEKLVALLGLEFFLARSPRHLSGGEKSRVALGRALLSAPDILLLDEPLAALDAGRRAEILPYLERLRDIAKIPMLYVSHAREEVAQLADRVVLLEQGRVTGQGSVFEMLTGLDATAPLGAMLEARATGVQRDGLSELRFEGGSFWVAGDYAQDALARNAPVRLRVAAEEILIARQEPQGLSANNILAVTVRALRFSGTHCNAELLCGNAKLVARITAASARRLELAPGMEAYAIVKTVTVEGAARAAPGTPASSTR